jgi:hypothetical protein
MVKVTKLDPEDEQAVVAYLEQLAKVMRGESRECLVCNATVESYREVRPCVYAEPCGHRQWQGRKPKDG